MVPIIVAAVGVIWAGRAAAKAVGAALDTTTAAVDTTKSHTTVIKMWDITIRIDQSRDWIAVKEGKAALMSFVDIEGWSESDRLVLAHRILHGLIQADRRGDDLFSVLQMGAFVLPNEEIQLLKARWEEQREDAQRLRRLGEVVARCAT